MRENKTLFITATDTGVGKTMVSGLLLGFLRDKGIDAGYQKWASTGARENCPDLTTCLKISGLKPEPGLLDRQAPYRFAFPASPHLAAELEKRKIEPARIIAAYREMTKRHEVLVVEGVGGLLVPLNRDLLLVDLVARLRLPVIVVARSGLGAINHTLLTIEALKAREIGIAGAIFTDSADEDEVIVRDNMRFIAETGGIEVLGRLPYCPEKKELIREFVPIGEKIGGILFP
ncbi:MAG: dethiobiotin synthase [Desulfobulbaceae bacterium]|nr:dethiobiotin synthase [Desulfobulbaceae bacterium]